MLETEKLRKPPKRRVSSGGTGQEPPVCAESPRSRPKSPAASLAPLDSRFTTRATNTYRGCARGGLPETEGTPKCADLKEKAGSDHRRRVRPPGSRKRSERAPSLQSSSWAGPSPARALLEEQGAGALGLPGCRGKRKACSRGRSSVCPVAPPAQRQASPGHCKPKGDCRRCSLQSEQPEEVSKQKARGQRGKGEPARKRRRDPELVSGQVPSVPELVPDIGSPRAEVEPPSESEKVRRVDILITHLTRELRCLKKWKKRQLLPGVGESELLLSLQKAPGRKKRARTIKAKAPPGPPLGPLDTTGTAPKLVVKSEDAWPPAPASLRQGQTPGLVRPLSGKRRKERRPGAGHPGWAAEGKRKGCSPGAATLAPEGLPCPGHCPGASPWEDCAGQLAAGRPGQLALAPLPLLPPAGDEAAPSPAAVGGDQGDSYAPNQPRARAWNQSIAELLCSLALPLPFLASPPFRRFMAQVDPCYHLPPPAFFSDKALPLLREAVSEQVLQALPWAEGGRLHLTVAVAVAAGEDYMAVTAHWGAIQPGSQQVGSGRPRQRAVLWVQGLPLAHTAEDRPRELREQVGLWLGRGSLQPGFLVSGGCPSLEQAMKTEGYTLIPCFAHCLDALVKSFLCHHHSVQIILGTAQAICRHFQGSVEARGLLAQLQRQCGLPAAQPFGELSEHWLSTHRLLEWLVEQQQPLKAYEEQQWPDKGGAALSASFWSLASGLVRLLQPFRVAVQESSVVQASLSQVLPQLRYLHIFLEQVRRHFEEQGGGAMGAAIRLTEGLALQLSTDPQLTELFYREELVLATLLDPRFKGKMSAILPAGSDIDHWKHVLVYKVKEIMVATSPLPIVPPLQSPGALGLGGGTASSHQAEGRGLELVPSSSLLQGQKRRSLLEQLESVGLLASKRSEASLSTEDHPASIMVKDYLLEDVTVGAQEDPLAYWEKRRDVWPALAQLATLYLSCPPTGAFSRNVLAALDSPAIQEHSAPLPVETVEHLLFLKTNLENFPSYTPLPLICPSGDLAGGRAV
ncbi:zinc finger BED domain-containing protein 6 [Talpa occidentalis]|uniref:zinc finger BED domain-containing protein 6 n=1 Tax=Talpa occidentalis TaxID=50954 RepID=UPI00188E33A2|nr:zinc finger BED domain-containing protein 6 [Talpa occidentalis]